jgi:outer membrane receptor for ferrienterochelin and colicins
LRYLEDDRKGGQTNYDHSLSPLQQNFYGTGIHNKLMEFSFKNGFLFPDEKFRTMGFIASARHHELNSFYGMRDYTGVNNMVNSSLIFQDIIKNSLHNFKTGASFIYDDYQEKFNDSLFAREEMIPGAFFEYNYSSPRFSFLIGSRGDYHNLYGLKPTGRLHLRFSPNPKATMRASAGTGFRTANIFVENSSVLASSRAIHIDEILKPEETFNSGGGYTRRFFLFNNEATFNLDYYYTYFFNQVVVDLDRDPQEVHFYNLRGKSYSHSAQADLDFVIVKNLTAKLSFKYYDVRSTYSDELLAKPLLSKYRFMQSVSYKTKNEKWKFDYIGNWYGKARVPGTDENPVSLQMPNSSQDYYIMHFQVTWISKAFEFYVGAENILNFTQKNAIIDNQNPFSNYFDASLVWGPLNGRNFYGGLRYTIAKKKEEKLVE